MSNNNTFNVFSVGSAAAGFQVDADYKFINEVKSTDQSLLISNGTSFPVDIKVVIEADTSVASVLTFIPNPNDGDVGKHVLMCCAGARGLVVADPDLEVVPFPQQKSILVTNSGGFIEWLPVPMSGNYAFGLRGGNWGWYEIETCLNACS